MLSLGLLYHSRIKKNNKAYSSSQGMPYSERTCSPGASHKPRHHEEPRYSLLRGDWWCEPEDSHEDPAHRSSEAHGNYFMIGVRKDLLPLATEQSQSTGS